MECELHLFPLSLYTHDCAPVIPNSGGAVLHKHKFQVEAVLSMCEGVI
jgi:hypothetical protein